MWIWDYKIAKNWKPKTGREWEWFLVRKINHGDFNGLTKRIIQRYLPKIKHLLDPGKAVMFKNFLAK